jgi:hypothetical protein
MGVASPASQFFCGIDKKYGVVHPFDIVLQDAEKKIPDAQLRYRFLLK